MLRRSGLQAQRSGGQRCCHLPDCASPPPAQDAAPRPPLACTPGVSGPNPASLLGEAPSQHPSTLPAAGCAPQAVAASQRAPWAQPPRPWGSDRPIGGSGACRLLPATPQPAAAVPPPAPRPPMPTPGGRRRHSCRPAAGSDGGAAGSAGEQGPRGGGACRQGGQQGGGQPLRADDGLECAGGCWAAKAAQAAGAAARRVGPAALAAQIALRSAWRPTLPLAEWAQQRCLAPLLPPRACSRLADAQPQHAPALTHAACFARRPQSVVQDEEASKQP